LIANCPPGNQLPYRLFVNLCLRYLSLASVVFLTLAATRIDAQELNIPQLEEPPVLEDFLSMAPDPLRVANMALVSGFTQRTPNDGAAESQRTDVYLGYDDRNLYVVFLAFDDEPENFVVNAPSSYSSE
jgi:hypothetical protein